MGKPFTQLARERRAAGLCQYCGEKPAPGKKSCQYHLDMMAAGKKRRRLAKVAKGLCEESWCERPALPGKRKCAACLARQAESFARWYKQKRKKPCPTT